MSQLYTAMYAYGWSLEESPERALAAIRERAGCDAVCLPFTYHSGKFLLPHSPRPRVVIAEPVSAYFHPDPARYANTAIKPVTKQAPEKSDLLGHARQASREAGLALVAWVVCLHSSVLGAIHPKSCQHNVFGDPMTFSLCPCDPDVREYLEQLLCDIAINYEPDAIELESLEFLPFMHGHHHELAGVGPDAFHEALLGLDFNPSTRRALEARGVDVERAAAFVEERLRRFARSRQEETGVRPDELGGMLLGHPELRLLFDARRDIITELAADLAAAVRKVSPARLSIHASWWRPLHLAWLEGHDLKRLGELFDGIGCAVYHPGDLEIADELGYAGSALDSHDKVTALVMPMPPQATSPEDVKRVVCTVQRAGVARIHFYNYSLMREENLDWVRAATREDRWLQA